MEYKIGDRIDYDDIDDMDAVERDDLYRDLRQRSMTLHDDCSDKVGVGMYARSGRRIEDLIIATEQPER